MRLYGKTSEISMSVDENSHLQVIVHCFDCDIDEYEPIDFRYFDNIADADAFARSWKDALDEPVSGKR